MRDEHKDAIEVSIIFYKGNRMMAVPKQPAPVQPVQEPTIAACIIGSDAVGKKIDGYEAAKVYAAMQKAMATPPAQPAPVQEPVAWTLLLVGAHNGLVGKAGEKFLGHPEHYQRVDVYTTPPAAEFVCSTRLCHYKAQPAPMQEPWGYGRMSWGEKMFLPTLPSVRDGGWMALYTTPPAAQPAPVQEPVGDIGWGGSVNWHKAIPEFGADLYTTPPAAQRQWVGLTDDEMYLNCPNWLSQEQCKVWTQQIEAKLKEKNSD